MCCVKASPVNQKLIGQSAEVGLEGGASGGERGTLELRVMRGRFTGTQRKKVT